MILLFVGLLIVAWPGVTGHGSDREYWARWANHIWNHGLTEAYGSGTDYPPLYQYILWIYTKLCTHGDDVSRNLARLRLFTIAFDIAGLWLVARWIGKPQWWQILALFGLLNIAYSHNTIVWGQVDGILATLLFAACYCIWKNRPLSSAVFFALALLMKLQAIVLLPVWGLLVLYGAAQSRRWGLWLVGGAGVFALTILAGCAPFLLTPDSRAALYKAVFASVDRYPNVSMMAANMWYWIVDTNPRTTLDTVEWIGGMTYKKAGLLLFFTASALALWPLLRRVALAIFSPVDRRPLERELIWMTAALVCLLFFFLPTQMHERYAHPALIFLTAYAFFTRDYFPYVLACIAYFLTLEKSMEWMLNRYDWILFDGRVIAAMWAAVIAYLFARLYGWKPRWISQHPERAEANQSDMH